MGKERVDLILVCDVTDAHRVTELSVGDRQALFTMRTTLGRIGRGHPFGRGLVSCITDGPGSIDEQMNQLYNQEFRNKQDDHIKALADDLIALERVQGEAKICVVLSCLFYGICRPSAPWIIDKPCFIGCFIL